MGDVLVGVDDSQHLAGGRVDDDQCPVILDRDGGAAVVQPLHAVRSPEFAEVDSPQHARTGNVDQGQAATRVVPCPVVGDQRKATVG